MGIPFSIDTKSSIYEGGSIYVSDIDLEPMLVPPTENQILNFEPHAPGAIDVLFSSRPEIFLYSWVPATDVDLLLGIILLDPTRLPDISNAHIQRIAFTGV